MISKKEDRLKEACDLALKRIFNEFQDKYSLLEIEQAIKHSTDNWVNSKLFHKLNKPRP